MAIWQVAFHLCKENENIQLTDPQFCESLKAVEKEFPIEKSWSKYIRQYGNLESTCIEIGTEDVYTDEISVRLDIRTVSKEQVQLICDFANKNGLLMCYKDKTFVADFETVKNILGHSDAKRSLIDPAGFFAELEQKQ